jgi:chromosomal replication initiation ATPase DnaA
MSSVRAFQDRFASRQPPAATRRGAGAIRRAIEPAVATVFEVDIEDLRAPTRGSPRAAFARQVAMYLAHVTFGATLTEIGILFERDRTTVAHACGVVEDRRDDPDLDCKLDNLERAVTCLIDALSLGRSRG